MLPWPLLPLSREVSQSQYKIAAVISPVLEHFSEPEAKNDITCTMCVDIVELVEGELVKEETINDVTEFI